jgi:hypothetical protein
MKDEFKKRKPFLRLYNANLKLGRHMPEVSFFKGDRQKLGGKYQVTNFTQQGVNFFP